MITMDNVDVSRNGSKFKTVCNPSFRLCDSEHKNPRCPLLHRKNTQPTYHWTDEAKDPHPQDMMQVRQETLELAMEALHLGMAMGPSPEMPVAQCGTLRVQPTIL